MDVQGGGIGEIRMTLEIVRADTGAKETHELIGKVLYDDHDAFDGSEERRD